MYKSCSLHCPRWASLENSRDLYFHLRLPSPTSAMASKPASRAKDQQTCQKSNSSTTKSSASLYNLYPSRSTSLKLTVVVVVWMQNVPVPSARMEITEMRSTRANLQPMENKAGKDMVLMIRRALDRSSRRGIMQSTTVLSTEIVHSSDQKSCNSEKHVESGLINDDMS
jgi:hypothetical protein